MRLRISGWILGLAGLISACWTPQQPGCTRSSECPGGMFCRIDECVPAAGPVNPASGPKIDAGETGAAPDASPGSRPDASAADTHGDAPSVPLECKRARPPAPGDLVLNEIMADPPSGPDGDTNGDGLRDARDDEFVEIVDVSDTPIYLGRVTLQVGGETVLEFPPSCLPPGGAAVVWGGFTGPGRPAAPVGAVSYLAPSGLSLTNGGGWLQLRSAADEVIDELKWGDTPEESLTRAPQLEGTALQPHSTLNDGRLHSPGLCADGTPTKGGCPEP